MRKDGRTDRHDEANSRSLEFCERAQKAVHKVSILATDRGNAPPRNRFQRLNRLEGDDPFQTGLTTHRQGPRVIRHYKYDFIPLSNRQYNSL